MSGTYFNQSEQTDCFFVKWLNQVQVQSQELQAKAEQIMIWLHCMLVFSPLSSVACFGSSPDWFIIITLGYLNVLLLVKVIPPAFLQAHFAF